MLPGYGNGVQARASPRVGPKRNPNDSGMIGCKASTYNSTRKIQCTVAFTPSASRNSSGAARFIVVPACRDPASAKFLRNARYFTIKPNAAKHLLQTGALRNESDTGSTFGAVRAVECLAYALSGKNITFSLSSTPRFARTSSDGSSWSCQFNSSSFWSRFVISYGCVPSSPCHRHPLDVTAEVAFESHRPRHSFQNTFTDLDETSEGAKSALLHSKSWYGTCP